MNVYCYTVGGRKLHVADEARRFTLCGFHVWQFVFAEEPVPPRASICEWCQAAQARGISVSLVTARGISVSLVAT